MSYAQTTGNLFDQFTPLFKEIFKSSYINLGYWDKTTKTIAQAQEKLVKNFGQFSKLGKGLEVVDIGCGTGEQDLYFLDHFQCKKILGINISKLQIDIAQNRIRNKKKYLSKIAFEVGDAHDLRKLDLDSYDRVLSLECSQYLDKKVFVQEAWDILKPKGYLCIADPIFNFPYTIDEKNFPSLLNRIEDEEIKNRYGFQIENKLNFFLQEKTKKIDGPSSKIHISFEGYLKVLEEKGFKVEEVNDLSNEVTLFYPSVEKEILKILRKKVVLDSTQIDLYITFLILSYINYCAYRAGLAKFYLIRAMKF